MRNRLLHDHPVRLLAILISTALLAMIHGCGKSHLQTDYSGMPHTDTTAPSSPGKPPAGGFPAANATAINPCPVPPHPLPRQSVTHEVAPLETIWRLAKMYDVPEDSIYLANNLKPGATIQMGQKLTIPNAKPMRHVVSLYPNNTWKYIVIHHTATDIGKALLINSNHHDRGFWNGLGYHFVIGNGTMGKLDGQIEVSPRWIKQLKGAHCKAGGMNERGIGIALVGNFNEHLPTPAQIDSLSYLLRLLTDYYKIPSSRVIGHRDANGANTDCPGKRFPWPTIRQCLTQF